MPADNKLGRGMYIDSRAEKMGWDGMEWNEMIDRADDMAWYDTAMWEWDSEGGESVQNGSRVNNEAKNNGRIARIRGNGE